MNVKLLLASLVAFGISVTEAQIAAAIKVKLAVNPALTDEQLVANEDGSLKHFFRGKIQFLVDFIWPDIEPTLDQVILAAAAEVRAELAAAA